MSARRWAMSAGRLAELEGHLVTDAGLTVIDGTGPCCSSAGAVFDAVEGSCRCCVASEHLAGAGVL